MLNKLILCFYIGSDGLSQQEIKERIESIKNSFSSAIENSVAMFFVPISGKDSKVECVNPVLVTEQEAKDKFNESMDRFNKVLNALEKKVEDEKK